MRIAELTFIKMHATNCQLQFAVDSPLPGMAADSCELGVVGWAAGESGPLESMTAYTNSDSRALHIARQHRPDLPVTRSAEDHFGYATILNLRNLGFPQIIELRGRIPGEPLELSLCTLGIKYEDTRIRSSRTPLIITSLGRSGSTYLMSLLSGHPSIATPSSFPYEERIACYFADNYRSITRAPVTELGLSRHWGKGHRSFPSNEALCADSLRRFQPAIRYALTSEVLRSCAANARRLVDLHYSYLAGRSVIQAPVFAEKMEGAFFYQEVLNSVYDDMFEIILIRDFRDVFVSAMRFNQKRNYYAFGAEQAATEEEWARNFAEEVKQIAEASQDRSSALVVRYEELVSRPSEVLRHILGAFSLANAEDIINGCMRKAAASDNEHHRTSVSAEASIARWKNDLPRSLTAVLNSELREPLGYFGYEME
ncbi:MAG TPA: sulfotransferase [Stellaceae bacterium]|nr:sulfotransferase [Stellaceae bacterium]